MGLGALLSLKQGVKLISLRYNPINSASFNDDNLELATSIKNQGLITNSVEIRNDQYKIILVKTVETSQLVVCMVRLCS